MKEDYPKKDIRLYLENFWTHLAEGFMPESGPEEDQWPPQKVERTTEDMALDVASVKTDIEMAIKSLPTEQRLAVVLHYILKESIEHIGLWLRSPRHKETKGLDSGLPMGNVSELINEGINSMHKFLNKKGWGGARKSSSEGKQT